MKSEICEVQFNADLHRQELNATCKPDNCSSLDITISDAVPSVAMPSLEYSSNEIKWTIGCLSFCGVSYQKIQQYFITK